MRPLRFGSHDGAREATGDTRKIARAAGFACALFDWPPAGRRSLLCESCDRLVACRAIALSRPTFGAIDSESERYSHAGTPRHYGAGLAVLTADSAVRR